MNIEYRTNNLLGEIRADTKEEGIFEGYFAVWDTVDSYNSRFIRGAFTDTLKKREGKIKLVWNHENGEAGKTLTIIGKPLDIKEDDNGCFVKAQILVDLPEGKKAWRFIKEGIINTMSFGFSTDKQKIVKGVRNIEKVTLYEISPVAFESNPQAEIDSLSLRTAEPEQNDQRGTDFSQTLEDDYVKRGRWASLDALAETLDDIWWETNLNNSDVLELLDKAIDDFKTKYLQISEQFLERYRNEQRNATPIDENEYPLSFALNQYLTDEQIGLNDLALSSSFSIKELRQLQRNRLIKSGNSRLKTLSTTMASAHAKLRAKRSIFMLSEFEVVGLNYLERKKINSLSKQREPETQQLAERIQQFRSELSDGRKSSF